MTMRITISGPRAGGKTYVGKLIADMLRREGYDVETLNQPARYRPKEGPKSVQIQETNEG